jgi:hypothetical protein
MQTITTNKIHHTMIEQSEILGAFSLKMKIFQHIVPDILCEPSLANLIHTGQITSS